MKRLFSVILCILVVAGTLPMFSVMVSAKECDVVETSGIEVEVTSYEQLKELLKNTPNGEILMLQNDIVVTDNDNDNEIVVGAWTDCVLDLNGYTISRTTRGIDGCLIKVSQGAKLTITDSSVDNSGSMIFSSYNYAGTSAVILANGSLNIHGGNFIIETPYEVGGGTVIKAETGYINIYDGVFDSHTAYGGDTIYIRHNSYLYDVAHCNIYGGIFYGKISNFDVAAFGDYSVYGCLYPSVYVFDGEFYIANPDHEYAGFAYCNNGWGRVVVAGGTVFYKCLNSSDQIFIDGVEKTLVDVEYEGKKGSYYEVTSSAMIGSDGLNSTERLATRLAKKDFSYYRKNGTIYKDNEELFLQVLNRVDVIKVGASQENSPLMWIENTNDVKTVNWYMSSEDKYNGADTPWSELADFRGCVLPFRFDFRPQEETVLYIRVLITFDNGTQKEDVVAVHYEEYKEIPPITSVEVTGVDEPVTGKNPDFTINETEEYYQNAMFWTDVTTSSHKTLKETDVFEEGHTYELEVWLRTNEGYKFNVDSDDWIDITATVCGKEAEVVGGEIAIILTVRFTLDKADDPVDELKLGDVDGDKEISVLDATLIQRSLAKQAVLTDEQLKRANTDKDSVVSVMDATNIQRLLARLITEF